jgi:hypothetical protein
VDLRAYFDIVQKNKYIASARLQTMDHAAYGPNPKLSVKKVAHVLWKTAAEVIN